MNTILSISLIHALISNASSVIAVSIAAILALLGALFGLYFGLSRFARYVTGNSPGTFGYTPSLGSFDSMNQSGKRNSHGGLNLLE